MTLIGLRSEFHVRVSWKRKMRFVQYVKCCSGSHVTFTKVNERKASAFAVSIAAVYVLNQLQASERILKFCFRLASALLMRRNLLNFFFKCVNVGNYIPGSWGSYMQPVILSVTVAVIQIAYCILGKYNVRHIICIPRLFAPGVLPITSKPHAVCVIVASVVQQSYSLIPMPSLAPVYEHLFCML